MIGMTVKRQHNITIALGAIMLVTIFIGSWYYYSTFKEIRILTGQLAEGKEKLTYLNSLNWEEAIFTAETELNQWDNQLSYLEDPVKLLFVLEKLANEAHVEIVFLKPGENLFNDNASYSELKISQTNLEVNLTGDWNNILTFFRLLDQLSPFVAIEDLRITNEGDKSSGTIKIIIYHLS